MLGLAFDPVTMDRAVARCLEWCAGPRSSHVVVTANAALLCMMRRDATLHEACRAGDMVVADGMSIVWAMKAAGAALPERVPGVDLMARLLEEGSRERRRAYFLGARPEVVSALVDVCGRRYPGLVIAGFRHGYFGEAEEAAVIQGIRDARPDILFVGMPSPFKDKWLERHRASLDVPVIVGVGGSFDVHAGYVKRAPKVLQASGMEWAWRLLMEPRRMWKRYLTTNSEFLWAAGREVISLRLGNGLRQARTAPRLKSFPEAAVPVRGSGEHGGSGGEGRSDARRRGARA